MGNCSCGCGNEVKEKFVMACSGGSNVGQISNSLMIKLKGKENIRPYCLAGVGADLSGFILNSKENDTILNKNLDSSFGVKTILDFIYNNPTETIDFANTKKEPIVETFKPNLQDLNEVGVTTNPNQSKLKNPKESKYRPDSVSYQNICRDIDDVLSVLEKIKGK